MRLLGKTAIVAGLAGAMALGSMTASQARSFRAGPAVAAGVAGFALGAAAANAGGYYGPGYAYDSYAYAPGYSSYGYSYEPAYGGYDSYAYSPGYRFEGSYNSNFNGPWHERSLQGRDW